jgi:polyphenol oxidase
MIHGKTSTDRRATAMIAAEHLLVPKWSVSPRVRAFSTTRLGGISTGRFGLAGGMPGGLNLGAGDPAEVSTENRSRFLARLPSGPIWLDQVHGIDTIVADNLAAGASGIRADAVVSAATAVPCMIRTADCLPVFLADRNGLAVGIAHAGWRGLARGVIESTIAAMRSLTGASLELIAWLGPAIGPQAFEVGEEVREKFIAADPHAEQAFVAHTAGKWHADLYMLAAQRLRRCDVTEIDGRRHCTYSEPQLFYSYRRDGVTGRMAHVIWLGA